MVVAVTRNWQSGDGSSGTRLYLWCPGCDDLHCVEVDPKNGRWAFDGNLDAPTVSPSILRHGVQWERSSGFFKPTHASVPAGRQIACHSFVRQGRWEFLGDCTHHLAGQTVPVPALPEGLFD